MSATLALALTLSVLGQKAPVAPEVNLATMVAHSGGFEMGWADTTPGPYGDGWFIDQQPIHSVTLDLYYLDEAEVTVGAFARFLTHAAGDYHFHARQPVERVRDGYLPIAGTEHEPMRLVTWAAARDYCRWAGKRLPTEAEYEYAVRGADGRNWPWAEGGASCARANYFTGASHCQAGPVRVGSHPEGDSVDGVADLVGNVAEWMADDYAPYDPATPAAIVPSSGLKVVRGGGWRDVRLGMRGHARRAVDPALRSDNIGFRCAYSEGDTLSADRGALTDAEDIDRELKAAPAAAPAPGAVRALTGLSSPQGVAYLDGEWYVADTGNGRVMRVEADNLEGTVVLSGLIEPRQLLAGGGVLWIAEAGASRVSRWTPGDATAEVVASFVTAPVAMASRDAILIVATADQIVWVDAELGTQATLTDGLDGVGSLALVDEQVWFTELGTQSLSNAQLARVGLSGGSVTTLVGQPVLQGALRVPTLTWDETSNQLAFPIVLDGWPYAGLIARAATTGGNLEVLSHGPPKMGPILATPDGLVLGSERTLLRATADAAYTTLGPWTSASAVATDGAGAVSWADQHSGVLWVHGLSSGQ